MQQMSEHAVEIVGLAEPGENPMRAKLSRFSSFLLGPRYFQTELVERKLKLYKRVLGDHD